jgi:hypothetical protein
MSDNFCKSSSNKTPAFTLCRTYFRLLHEMQNKKIIIKFVKCNSVVTRWQWLFYMYTKYEIVYY